MQQSHGYIMPVILMTRMQESSQTTQRRQSISSPDTAIAIVIPLNLLCNQILIKLLLSRTIKYRFKTSFHLSKLLVNKKRTMKQKPRDLIISGDQVFSVERANLCWGSQIFYSLREMSSMIDPEGQQPLILGVSSQAAWEQVIGVAVGKDRQALEALRINWSPNKRNTVFKKEKSHYLIFRDSVSWKTSAETA